MFSLVTKFVCFLFSCTSLGFILFVGGCLCLIWIKCMYVWYTHAERNKQNYFIFQPTFSWTFSYLKTWQKICRSQFSLSSMWKIPMVNLFTHDDLFSLAFNEFFIKFCSWIIQRCNFFNKFHVCHQVMLRDFPQLSDFFNKKSWTRFIFKRILIWTSSGNYIILDNMKQLTSKWCKAQVQNVMTLWSCRLILNGSWYKSALGNVYVDLRMLYRGILANNKMVKQNEAWDKNGLRTTIVEPRINFIDNLHAAFKMIANLCHKK